MSNVLIEGQLCTVRAEIVVEVLIGFDEITPSFVSKRRTGVSDVCCPGASSTLTIFESDVFLVFEYIVGYIFDVSPTIEILIQARSTFVVKGVIGSYYRFVQQLSNL